MAEEWDALSWAPPHWATCHQLPRAEYCHRCAKGQRDLQTYGTDQLPVLAWLEATGSGVAFQKPFSHEGKRTWYWMLWLTPRRAFTEKFACAGPLYTEANVPMDQFPSSTAWAVKFSSMFTITSTAVMSGHLVGSEKPWEYKDTESSWAANHSGLGEPSTTGGKSSLALLFCRQPLRTPSLSGYHVALASGHI